ncbi:MAG: hypothetical protein H5T73_08745 [Actinobacteria bacterium]|nr:hypothetical protein [Actinomycetota bacterium]
MRIKWHKRGIPVLLAIVMVILPMALMNSCSKHQDLSNEAQVSTEDILLKCVDAMREKKSMKIISEQWFRSNGDIGIQKKSEVYRTFPETSHTVYEHEGPIYPDDIVEVWRFGKEKYVRYGDERIETSIAEDNDIFPELKLLEMAQEAEFERVENLEGVNCYVINAKMPHDLVDVRNGYLLAKFYIDERDYLLRRLIVEDYPIRYFDQAYDDSYVQYLDISYSEYDRRFEIVPPK